MYSFHNRHGEPCLMIFLKAYIISLCSLMVIFSAIYTVIPVGDTKKTLRSVIGIITALALISPFFGRNDGLLAFEFPDSENLVDYDRAEEMEKRTLRQVGIVVEEQVKKTLDRDCEVRVTVSEDGTVEKVEVENVTEYEKNLLSKKIGIESYKIEKY